MKKSRISDESLLKCRTIYGLLEADHSWAQLYTPGMLKKVGLLPPDGQVVQVIDEPIDLGE